MTQQAARLSARRRRDPDATYEAIVSAARALMAERGPEALTVADVAHRARVNRTTAYQHFRTREDLIGAVIARLANDVSLMLTTDMPVGARLDHMVKYFLDHPEIARLWMFQMLSDIQLPSHEGWERYLKTMRGFAASDRTQDGIDAEMLAHILVASTLVWSLKARGKLSDPAALREAAGRFSREVKRLLLFGAMKPDKWPELVAELSETISPAQAGPKEES